MFSQVEMEKNKLNLPNMRRLEKTFLQRFFCGYYHQNFVFSILFQESIHIPNTKDISIHAHPHIILTTDFKADIL